MSNPLLRKPSESQDSSVATSKPGRPKALHENEEHLIAEAAMYFAQNNNLLMRQKLCELTQHLVQMMASARRHRVPFLSKPPSKSWLNGFLYRHPGFRFRQFDV